MDHRIHQIPQPHVMPLPAGKKPADNKPDISFKDMLRDANQLKVSKHAEQRLHDRRITINESQWNAITEKVDEAKHKGVTDSLVLTGEAALLVNTKNRTVITAMNKHEAASKIFTNINGTILIDE
ncbi:flagellar operon protein [Lentibacillus persicus]|uniref:Flagellar operon protein n=1 Tax=Lentibacillus persicus TaxID=640948 RepID=A0A1I1VBP0_9BACI|nr:TIGR02530 family flagellar biosynthesis protein [Lentibacillus persicus]SFD80511.1 flagellar operon protein [Lentibacillus persicus]